MPSSDVLSYPNQLATLRGQLVRFPLIRAVRLVFFQFRANGLHRYNTSRVFKFRDAQDLTFRHIIRFRSENAE